MSTKSAGRIRYAVVGAGWFGQAAVLPAFAAVRSNSQLVAIFSGDAQKRSVLSGDYEVPAYPYEQYEEFLASGQADAVYIVSPNSIHKDQTIQAALHGVHVLCEKPLAESATAAAEMVDACERAGVLLMTAYRLHFEPANLKAIELIRGGKIGEPRLMVSTFTQQVDPDNSRLDAALGGHPLLDAGIYCVNAARYLFRAEPVEVTAFQAHGTDPRFQETPEMVSAVLRFPGDRLASFTCGFGEAKTSAYQVLGTRGDLRMDPAYTHRGERAMAVTVDGKTTNTTFPDTDQIAPEIEYFSDCIQNQRRPEPDGGEGLIDLRIIEAIRSSASKGMAVPIQPVQDRSRPDRSMEKTRPRKADPDLVNAAPPQA